MGPTGINTGVSRWILSRSLTSEPTAISSHRSNGRVKALFFPQAFTAPIRMFIQRDLGILLKPTQPVSGWDGIQVFWESNLDLPCVGGLDSGLLALLWRETHNTTDKGLALPLLLAGFYFYTCRLNQVFFLEIFFFFFDLPQFKIRHVDMWRKVRDPKAGPLSLLSQAWTWVLSLFSLPSVPRGLPSWRLS